MRPYSRYTSVAFSGLLVSAGSGTDAFPLDTPVRPYKGLHDRAPSDSSDDSDLSDDSDPSNF